MELHTLHDLSDVNSQLEQNCLPLDRPNLNSYETPKLGHENAARVVKSETAMDLRVLHDSSDVNSELEQNYLPLDGTQSEPWRNARART